MPLAQTAPTIHTASFRDPVGRVVLAGNHCFRVTTPQAGNVLQQFLTTDLAQRLINQGKLIATRERDSIPEELLQTSRASDWQDQVHPRVFEHEVVSFANYPYEWPAEMFESAARLTLELAAAVLPLGFNLKDGSPWNVMFRGPEPVFLDLASFEHKDPLEKVWMPYGQFVRTFLSPLLVWRSMRVAPGEHFRVSRDGLKPLDCYRRLGLARALRPPATELCAVPAALAWWAARQRKTTTDVRPALARSPEEAEFVLTRLLRRLEHALKRVAPRPARSDWTGYADEVAAREFASGYFEAKGEFVTEALELARPTSCLDIGCNTGYFSLMAAAAGAGVVAVDSDPASVGDLYRTALTEKRNVLPLIIDFARPTPALGWNNSETVSFLDRVARSRFDMVMMLALIHHLCLIDRVPLREVAKLAGRLAPRWLLIEFVPREDPLAQRMPGFWAGDSDWSPYDRATFEDTFDCYFRSVRSTELAGSGRWIYLMERRAGGDA